MCFRNSPWYVNCWLLPLRMLMDGVAAVQFAVTGNVTSTKAVGKAYLHFFKWLIQEKQSPRVKKSLYSLPGVLKKSIVWQYYVLKRRRYENIR